MKITAAVLERGGITSGYAEEKALTVRQVDLDPPGPGEVLIRLAAAGCR
jgi:alcohol dehydrogenase